MELDEGVPCEKSFVEVGHNALKYLAVERGDFAGAAADALWPEKGRTFSPILLDRNDIEIA